MPSGIEALNKAQQEFSANTIADAEAARKLTQPVSKKISLRDLTVEQIRENKEWQQRKIDKAWSDKIADAFSPDGIEHFATTAFNDGRHQLAIDVAANKNNPWYLLDILRDDQNPRHAEARKTAQSRGIASDVYDNHPLLKDLAKDPLFLPSLVANKDAPIDWKRALESSPTSPNEDMKRAKALGREAIAARANAPLGASLAIEAQLAKKYGARMPSDLRTHTQGTRTEIEYPKTIEELRRSAGFKHDIPLSAKERLEASDTAKLQKLRADYDAALTAGVPADIQKAYDALQKGAHAYLLADIEPREAALRAKEPLMPHYPIEETHTTMPLVYEGPRLAKFDPLQAQAHGIGEKIANTLGTHAGDTEKEYAALASNLRKNPDFHTKEVGALPALEKYRKPLEDYKSYVERDEASDPTYRRYMHDAAKEAQQVERKMKEIYDTRHLGLAGALTNRGASLSSSAKLSQAALQKSQAADIAEARDRIMSRYNQMAQAAVNAKRGHAYSAASSIANAMEKENQGAENRVEMRQRAQEMDKDAALKAQGVADLGRTQQMAMKDAGRRLMAETGRARQEQQQAEYDAAKREHAERISRPLEQAGYAGAVARGAMLPPSHLTTGVDVLPPRQPNVPAMDTANVLSAAQNIRNFMASYNQPYGQQPQQGFVQQHARGGPVLRRAEGGTISTADALLGAYNNQLQAYQNALAMRKAKQQDPTEAAWQGVGDQAQYAAYAGARKMSPMEGFGHAIGATQQRYDNYRKALAQKEKEDMEFEKSLTEAHGDRYKHAATVEEHRADRAARREHEKEMLGYYEKQLAEMGRHHRALEGEKEQKRIERKPKEQAALDKAFQMMDDGMNLSARGRALETMSKYVYTGPASSKLPFDIAGLGKGGRNAYGIFDRYSQDLTLDKFASMKGARAHAMIGTIQGTKPGVNRSMAANVSGGKELDTQGLKLIQSAISEAKRHGATDEEIQEALEVKGLANEEGIANVLGQFGSSLKGDEKMQFKKDNAYDATLKGWQERTKHYKDLAFKGKKKNLEANAAHPPQEGEGRKVPGVTEKDQEDIDLLLSRPTGTDGSPPVPPSAPPGEQTDGIDWTNLGKRALTDAIMAPADVASFVTSEAPTWLGKQVGLVNEETEPWMRGTTHHWRQGLHEGLGYKEPEGEAGKIGHDIVGTAAGMLGGSGVGSLLSKGAGLLAGTAPKVAKGLGGTGRFLGAPTSETLAGKTKELSGMVATAGTIGGAESFLRNEMDITNPIVSGGLGALGIIGGKAAAKKATHGIKRVLGQEEVPLAQKQMEEKIVEHITGGNKERLKPFVEALEGSESPLEGYNPTTAETLEMAREGSTPLSALEKMRTRAAASPELALQKKEGAQRIPESIEELRVQGVPSSELKNALKEAHAADVADVTAASAPIHETPRGAYEATSEKVRGTMGKAWLDALGERARISKPLYKEVDKVKKPVKLGRLEKAVEKYDAMGEALINEQDRAVLTKAFKMMDYTAKGKHKAISHLFEMPEVKAKINEINSHAGEGYFESIPFEKQMEHLNTTLGPKKVKSLVNDLLSYKPKNVGSILSTLRGELQDRVKNAYETSNHRRRGVLSNFLRELDDDMADTIPAAADARKAYREGSKAVNAIMEDPMINKVMDKSYYGNYHNMSEASTVDHFLKGKNSAEAARKLIQIAGKDSEAAKELRDHGRGWASEMLERGATPKNIQQFIKNHPGLFVLDPALKGELNNVAKHHQKLASRYGRTNMGEDVLASYENPESIVGKIFGEENSGAVATEILERIKKYDRGRDAATNAVIDHLLKTTKKGAHDFITPAAFTDYIDSYRAPLKAMLPEESMAKLERIYDIMSAKKRVNVSEGTETQPFQKLSEKLLEDSNRGTPGKIMDAVVDYVVGKTVGKIWRNIPELAERRKSKRERVLDEILMDPQHAKKVFERSLKRGAAGDKSQKVPYTSIIGVMS